jgi:hypothetical protein
MKMLKIYNRQCIERVMVYPSEPVWHMVYRPESTSLLGKRKPAGFYDELRGEYCGNEAELLDGSYDGNRIIVIDGVANWQPYVEIGFVSRETERIRFDTVAECNEYAQTIMDKTVERRNQLIVSGQHPF